MSKITLKNINKIYKKDIEAVSDFNLTVEDGEFVVFIGPSGCGKTTVLRMIAGLEGITNGQLYIDDELTNDIKPKDRNVAMIFQNYALYPHLTVSENLGFSLIIKKLEKNEIAKKVKEASKILEIEHLLDRKPKELSGGEKQRVAMGRAIVRNPSIFLMDEPLSNLDAKLRIQLRNELKKIHRKLNNTIIYVTHDQAEAMTLGSKIVVMKDGHIQQIGTPQELFLAPANKFVAGFIGYPQMNFITSKIQNIDGKLFIDVYGRSLELDKRLEKSTGGISGDEITVGIRPEDIKICEEISSSFSIKIDYIETIGFEHFVFAEIEGQQLVMKTTKMFEHEDNIFCEINTERIYLFNSLGDKITL